MKKNKEFRAYLVDISDVEDAVFDELSDDEVIDLAERNGDLYSLDYFAEQLNCDFPLTNYYVRFIEVEVYN